MGIPFTVTMGFLFTITLAFLFTVGMVFLFTISSFSVLSYIYWGVVSRYGGGMGDFAVYYGSARVIRTGGNIYDSSTLIRALNDAGILIDNVGGGYIYPPFFALAMTPLSYLSLRVAYFVWVLINQIFLASIIYMAIAPFKGSSRYLKWAAISFIVANFTPLFRELEQGQVNLLITSQMVLSVFLAKSSKDYRAGISLGFATMIKITPSLVVLYFLWKGKYKVVFSSALSFVVLHFVSVLLSGKLCMKYFIEILPRLLQLTPLTAYPVNQSLSAFFARLFIENPYTLLGSIMRILRGF